jgi:F-type H+-transporting ATPase subunit b
MTATHPITSLMQQASIYLLQASHGGEHHTMTLMERLQHSNVFNVILVALILGFLIKKFNLLSGIGNKQAQIAAEVQAIENQKKEALAQLEEAKRRTANLQSEVNDILNSARESAESISAQILVDARAESTKIIENAKRRVELEQRSAIKDLERRLLNDALMDARSELANTLTTSDQKRSVEAFIDELPQLKGGSPL